MIALTAGVLTRRWHLEIHSDEFKDRKDPNDITIHSMEWKYSQIPELWRHQWFWGFLMAFSFGLLIYGTEHDENYVKAVLVRLTIAFGLYYSMYLIYVTNRDYDDRYYMPLRHVIRGLIT